MRTTLCIDDDVLTAARALARSRGISLGQAVSDLARRGISGEHQVHNRDGFVVFASHPDDRPFGLEEIQQAEEADDIEYARRVGQLP